MTDKASPAGPKTCSIEWTGIATRWISSDQIEPTRARRATRPRITAPDPLAP